MTKNHIPIAARKAIPVECPVCLKQFKNIYVVSAHKGHCAGTRNTKHLDDVRAWNKGKILHEVENVFVEGSTFATSYLKKLILQKNMKKYSCECCGITEWNNKELVLELDHIDGVSNNNRLENLRFLCPNCHSQTPTFRGRNINLGSTKVSDEDLLEALKTTSSPRQALLKVGLAPKGGNYGRCYRLLSNSKESQE
jgi:Zn finger protein HypA/HybF involved in hydrogenase expression